ncbi:MAG: vitamin B12 dependent methionine synthase, partial [Eggerthellaceae bacterium]|nr:vitamin B12 dependent methionine synthase [Eggerthellaceae bacterium]
PGYGDLPLEVQPDLLGLLDASRRLGITLSDSLLMSPTKSVTAIVGLRPAERKCEVSE